MLDTSRNGFQEKRDKDKNGQHSTSSAHPALFPLHDSVRLGRAKGVHLRVGHAYAEYAVHAVHAVHADYAEYVDCKYHPYYPHREGKNRIFKRQ